MIHYLLPLSSLVTRLISSFSRNSLVTSIIQSLGTRFVPHLLPTGRLREGGSEGWGGGEREDIYTRRLRGGDLLSCYSDSC